MPGAVFHVLNFPILRFFNFLSLKKGCNIVSKYRNFLVVLTKPPSRDFFETRFLEEAEKFIAGLDARAIRKLLYNVDLAQQTNDPKLFKKLNKDIWEFRVRYAGIQIRLLAFWDKTDRTKALVFATHGFIKKVDKVPSNEIVRAENIMKRYFETKGKI